MTALLIALNLFLLAAVLALAVRVYLNLGLRRRLRHTVIVHTTDHRSIRGVLLREYSDTLELVRAEYLEGSEATQLAGDILLPRSKVLFVQALPVAEA